MRKIDLVIYAKGLTKSQLDDIKMKLRGLVSSNDIRVVKDKRGKYNLLVSREVAEFFKS